MTRQPRTALTRVALAGIVVVTAGGVAGPLLHAGHRAPDHRPTAAALSVGARATISASAVAFARHLLACPDDQPPHRRAPDCGRLTAPRTAVIPAPDGSTAVLLTGLLRAPPRSADVPAFPLALRLTVRRTERGWHARLTPDGTP